MEHPGRINPWGLKEKRFGVKIKEVPIGLPPKSVDEIVTSFEKAITPRTKIISAGHTVYISGLTAFSVEGIELERIVDYVRERYNIIVTTLGSKQAGTYGVRVSTPIYVSFKQIDMFLE